MTVPELTVVVRSTEGECLDPLIESVASSAGDPTVAEVLVVARGQPSVSYENKGKARIIVSSAKRIEAKLLGAQNASATRVMYVDSDQILSRTLVGELRSRFEDMVIVPERSASRNLMGALLDARRNYVESRMKIRPDERLPVIPRVFNRSLLLRAFSSMPTVVIEEVTETEDSLLFHECLKVSSSVGWCRSFLLNQDPGIVDFMKKSLRYGYRNERAIILGHLPSEYVQLIRGIQATSAVGWGFPSAGAVASNVLRGIPYVAGTVLARVRVDSNLR